MKSLKMNLYQIFLNPIFYFSIFLIVGMSFVSIYEYNPTDVVQAFQMLFTLSFFKKLIVIFTSLTYVAGFCNDWNNQYIKAVVVRSGKEDYINGKFLACTISCFASSFLGLAAFGSLLSLQIPVSTFLEENNFSLPYGKFINTMPVFYLLIVITIFSVAMTFWGLTGLLLSAYIPNSFVAISSPLVFSYILEELTAQFPPYLNIYYLTRGTNLLHQGAGINFLYNIFAFVFMMVLVYFLFRYMVKRRIANETV